MDFPNVLKMLREKRGYSQKQLADVLHVSKNSVSHYELGISMPSIDIIINMADIFDVSIDYLLGISNVNLSKRLLDKPIDKNTTAENVLESILRLDKEHKMDLLKLLRYIVNDNKAH